MMDQAFEDLRVAEKLMRSAKSERTRKRARELEDKARRQIERAKRMVDSASVRRASGNRYGRAKTRIGVYDPARGWSDRDRRRARRRRRSR
jgi:hypothetical protein